MRPIAFVFLVACGSSVPVSARPLDGPVAAGSCEADPDPAAGNHDRYLFQDPTTELFGFKTQAGDVVIPPTLHHASEFGPGGVSSVIDTVTPFVFIDVSGKVIAKAYASDNGPDYFQEGFARIVGLDGKIGFIDDRGQIAIAPTFDDASPFCHGEAEVTTGGKSSTVRRPVRERG